MRLASVGSLLSGSAWCDHRHRNIAPRGRSSGAPSVTLATTGGRSLALMVLRYVRLALGTSPARGLHRILPMPPSLRRIVPLGLALSVGCASPQLMVATFVPTRPGVVTETHVNVTGNWLSAVSMNDGTSRRSYFDLVQRGDTITGTIRTTQFFYDIVESAWDSTGFTIVGAMKDGGSVRRQEWHGRLVGDSLHLVAIRRPAPGAPTTPTAVVSNASTTSAAPAPPRPQPELVAYRV